MRNIAIALTVSVLGLIAVYPPKKSISITPEYIGNNPRYIITAPNEPPYDVPAAWVRFDSNGVTIAEPMTNKVVFPAIVFNGKLSTNAPVTNLAAK